MPVLRVNHCSIEVFPAMFQANRSRAGGKPSLEDSEAGLLLSSAEKGEVLPCDACGQFLCSLCDCELDGRHICPSCLETGKKKGKLQGLENHRTLYDSIALSLAIVPAVTVFERLRDHHHFSHRHLCSHPALELTRERYPSHEGALAARPDFCRAHPDRVAGDKPVSL